MDDKLNQAIMATSSLKSLKNKCLEYEFKIDKRRHNKHKNYCAKLSRLRKQKYHNSWI